MNQPKQVLLLALISMLCLQCKTNNTRVNSALKEHKLVWSDEFESDGAPDPNNWAYDVGDGCPMVCGWGNNELQFYTKENRKNARIEDGNLIIEAHKEKMGGKNFTSARLVTKGLNEWKYGTIEIRAKLPEGVGTWPALWMLPTHNTYGGWPRSGEIDIMEHVGYSPDSVLGTVHTEAFNHILGTQDGGAIIDDKVEEEWHTHKIVWKPDSIMWYMDDQHYHTFRNEKISPKEWPFDQPFHLIINMAIGGNWGGKKGVDQDNWPRRFIIDYVRVYQDASDIK